MATIYLTLSAKSDTNPQKEIRIRFKHGKIDQQAKTNIFIPAEYWDSEIQQYKATEKHLKDFAKSIRKEDFDFSNIDQAFYDKYVSFLQEKGFTQNSVGKHIRIFKLMLNEATIQGYNTNAYYNSFHVFTEETDTIYLNENELRQLKDADFSKTPYLDRVRDWFLLLAWTGSRFSDLEKVAKTDIKDGFITFRQQKTNNDEKGMVEYLSITTKH